MDRSPLLELARTMGMVRSRADERLVQAAETGGEADLSPLSVVESHVSETLLRWLLTYGPARALCSRTPLRIRGAIFDAVIDLAGSAVDVPLSFTDCQFFAGIRLAAARLSGLRLAGGALFPLPHDDSASTSSRRALDAVRMESSSDVLIDGVQIHRGLNLQRVTVRGMLRVHSDPLRQTEAFGIDMHEAEVSGPVLITWDRPSDSSVTPVAELVLEKAHLAGGLRIEPKLLRTPTGPLPDHRPGSRRLRLSAADLRVDGVVTLRWLDLELVGLRSARIAGDVEIYGCRVSPPDLIGEDGVPTLDLRHAHIEGVLDLYGTTERAVRPTSIQGDARFEHAYVGVLADHPENWGLTTATPRAGVHLDGVRIGGFAHGSPMSRGDLRQRWVELGTERAAARHAPFSVEPFRTVAARQRESGDDGAATRLLIRGEQLRFRTMRNSASPRARFVGLLAAAIYGPIVAYGYRPGRAALIMIGLWIASTFVFWYGWNHAKFVPTEPWVYAAYRPALTSTLETRRFPPDQERGYRDLTLPPDSTGAENLPEYTVFYAPAFAADALLPFVELGQERAWQPVGWVRAWMWLHILGGWLLASFLIHGVNRLVRS
ncbi:MAG: hypothetical protein IPM29_28370 [Planctomycetes bacterium]|nr:hypothetical protein [Planctomycetota bacterium]